MTENHGAAVEKNNSDRPLPLFHVCGHRRGSGLLGVDLSGQTGNFAGRGLFVKDAFFGSVIDDGFGRVELHDGILRTLRHGEAHILDNVFDPGLNRFVPQAPTLVLASALQC
jgi:hypothetical protein